MLDCYDRLFIESIVISLSRNEIPAINASFEVTVFGVEIKPLTLASHIDITDPRKNSQENQQEVGSFGPKKPFWMNSRILINFYSRTCTNEPQSEAGILDNKAMLEYETLLPVPFHV